jgi:hypothetical protein
VRISRRRFLAGSALAIAGGTVSARALLVSSGGPSATPSPQVGGWSIPGAAALLAAAAPLFAANARSVVVGGTTYEYGFTPANGTYDRIWTCDEGAAIFHHPGLQTAAQRRQWFQHRVRWSVANSTYPGWVPDSISPSGTVYFFGGGVASATPYFSNIWSLVLALWSDWDATGDTATFAANQSYIDDCLAIIPRSASGCAWSDPASPSTDFLWTDGVSKTGDCAMGTVVLAHAYRMLDAISGGGSSTNPAGTPYAALRAAAEAAIGTLWNSGTGFLRASSGNNSGVDDVWATALACAEDLLGSNRAAAAAALRSAYLAGTVTDGGFVRHLPAGQFWTGTSYAHGVYQNGGFWAEPVWDCVRAVSVVDHPTARAWASDFVATVAADAASSGAAYAPHEWRNGTNQGAAGYTAWAAMLNRFA